MWYEFFAESFPQSTNSGSWMGENSNILEMNSYSLEKMLEFIPLGRQNFLYDRVSLQIGSRVSSQSR